MPILINIPYGTIRAHPTVTPGFSSSQQITAAAHLPTLLLNRQTPALMFPMLNPILLKSRQELDPEKRLMPGLPYEAVEVEAKDTPFVRSVARKAGVLVCVHGGSAL